MAKARPHEAERQEEKSRGLSLHEGGAQIKGNHFCQNIILRKSTQNNFCSMLISTNEKKGQILPRSQKRSEIILKLGDFKKHNELNQ